MFPRGDDSYMPIVAFIAQVSACMSLEINNKLLSMSIDNEGLEERKGDTAKRQRNGADREHVGGGG